MHRILLSGLAAAALVAVAPRPAHAKGPTVRIVLVCSWSSRSIEITDSATARAFGPWNNGFFDTSRNVENAPAAAQPCQAFFYINLGRGGVRMMYAAVYVPGADGQPGYIRLPAEGDPWYPLNAGTMRRAGLEGRWLYATPAWDALMKPLIASVGGQTKSPA